jgi:hypothetical protein
MKILIILLSIVFLLVGLPLLHGFLAFQSIDMLSVHPTTMSFFYLFTFPAWTLAIMVFVVEIYRRGFILKKSRINNTLMLGLLGMIIPTAGLALSPVGNDISLLVFVGIAVIGLFVGLLGAVLFQFTTGWIEKNG